MSPLSASHRAAFCSSTSLLYAVLSFVPATAQGTDWIFDSVYGGASVLALSGGQMALDRDGAGQQARTITYTPGDNAAPIRIERSYGPGGRKAIEHEDGVTRHHVYGIGLAPILRTESDGGLTYQIGLETLSVSASSAVTAAHRVVDLKESTVAVLNEQAQAMQRVSYTAYGNMRAESAAVDTYSAAALLAGYEGLRCWLLDTDYVVDNRARLYAASAGRFSELDYVRQALAYEARGNNPVTRVDPDGNVNFDQLINALERDRSISLAFGDYLDSSDVVKALLHVTARLTEKKIDFRIYQASGLLSFGPARWRVPNPRFEGTPEFNQLMGLLGKGVIIDLDRGPTAIEGEQKRNFIERFNARVSAGQASAMDDQDYMVFKAGYKDWKINIPAFLATAKRNNMVGILIVNANHLQQIDLVYRGDHSFSDRAHVVKQGPGYMFASPWSSYGLQNEHSLTTVMSVKFAQAVQRNPNVLPTLEFAFLDADNNVARAFALNIPYLALRNHPAFAGEYRDEWIAHRMNPNSVASGVISNANDEKEEEKKEFEEKESEEKSGDGNAAISNQRHVRPMEGQKNSYSSGSTFDKK